MFGFPSLYDVDQYSDQNDTGFELLTPSPSAPILPGTYQAPSYRASGGSQEIGSHGPAPIVAEEDAAVALKR